MIQSDLINKTATITPGAYLDAARVEELRKELHRLIADGVIYLTFDLRSTQFVCSAALGLLVEMHNQVSERGGKVTLENLNPTMERLLADTKLLALFTSPDTGVDRLQALEAVQEHMSQELLFLSFINTITSNILRSEPSGVIYGQMLEAIVRSLKPRRALILLVSEGADKRLFQVAASEGFDPHVLQRLQGMSLREYSVEGQCLAAKSARLFDAGWKSETLTSPLLDATEAHEGILEPVVGRGKALGLLLLEADKGASTFFPQSVPPLQIFANVCGLAVEKQALLDAIRHKNNQLSNTLNELNSTRDALMEAGKLAVMGALIRGLGHRLNNMLVPIMGYAQMLAMQMGAGSGEAEKIRIIENAALDIKKTIDNMRSLTLVGEQGFEALDMRDVIDSCLKMQDYLFREARICVERNYGGVNAVAPVHRERITQAFLALFHRLPKTLAKTPDKLLRITLDRDETHLIVRVLDNGRVIPPKELKAVEKPFDHENPFEDERLNFSIARTVLKDHKGSLDVESSEEIGGTAVTLRIPTQRKQYQDDISLIV